MAERMGKLEGIQGRCRAAQCGEPRPRWTELPRGFIKLNCDVSVRGIGIGVVARDDKGELCFAAARSVGYASTPSEAEAEAVVWAVQLAEREGITHGVIESDCLEVIGGLQRQPIARSAKGNVLMHRQQSWQEACRGAVGAMSGGLDMERAQLLASIRPVDMLFDFIDSFTNFRLTNVLWEDLAGSD